MAKKSKPKSRRLGSDVEALLAAVKAAPDDAARRTARLVLADKLADLGFPADEADQRAAAGTVQLRWRIGIPSLGVEWLDRRWFETFLGVQVFLKRLPETPGPPPPPDAWRRHTVQAFGLAADPLLAGAPAYLMGSMGPPAVPRWFQTTWQHLYTVPRSAFLVTQVCLRPEVVGRFPADEWLARKRLVPVAASGLTNPDSGL